MTLSNSAVPDIVLQYTTFKQITDDISDARVYGGIHFRTDQDAGERLGKAMGRPCTGTIYVACTITSERSTREQLAIVCCGLLVCVCGRPALKGTKLVVEIRRCHSLTRPAFNE